VSPWHDGYATEEERLRGVTDELRGNGAHHQSSGALPDSLVAALMTQVIALQAHIDRLKAGGR
jgi:hypothetical protein